MKRGIVLLLAVSLVMSFAGCFPEKKAQRVKNAPTDNVIVADEIAAATTEPAEEIYYTVKISRADFPVYDGPSYDFYPVGTVEEAGSYTIVEEAEDGEGNLWGKLKSGLGWIDLTLNEKEKQNMPPVTVSRASQKLLDSGNYYFCKADTSSYGFDISFLSHEVLHNVSFFKIQVSDAYIRGPELFRIPVWEPGTPFVATVSFPGIASLYGLEFTDSRGVTHIYSVWESGRNGSIGVSPFTTQLIADEAAIPETLNMLFCSGVGAWGTTLTLHSDGTFAGSFSDSEMCDMGEGYPRGSCYVCAFDGAFQITGTSAYAVTLTLKELNKVDYGADKWIEDQILYIASEAYGIEGGSTFLLYMPDTPVSKIPEEMRHWAYDVPETGTLGCYGLYCIETECAFFSF